MQRQSIARHFVAASILLMTALPAAAAPRDAAANKKIDEAINTHYLATKFDKAEGVLTGTIKACGKKCSGAVIARAWMYVGIVRGSGKQDEAGAKKAFEAAVKADPKVKLDEALATPETKKLFEAVAGSGGGGEAGGESSGGSGGGSGTPEPPDAGDLPGDMECSPLVAEVQTRRPIPVSCTTEEDAVKAELRYKEYGGDKWVAVPMKKKGDFFQAMVPCAATQLAGKIRYYVRAQDASGDVVDTRGSKSKPFVVNVVPETSAEAPAFPDRDPPDRCEEQVECPPDFPGCKSGGGGTKPWGASCASNDECKSGLACVSGTCESAQACTTNSECPSGNCDSGVCKDADGPSGPFKKNWIGLHVAYDVAIMGGDNVCSASSQANDGFACYYKGQENQYRFDPQPGVANKISTGFAPATIRFLASYDRVLGENLTLGARAGFAINGGPPAGQQGSEVDFLPFHGEARVGYWFGTQPFAKKGFRPYVHAGGGMAQVDAKLPVTILDCAQGQLNADRNNSTYISCRDGAGAQGTRLELDAYKKLGQGFVTAGGGAVYALSPNSGFQANLNLMMMLGTSGFVIEPSIGYVFGL